MTGRFIVISVTLSILFTVGCSRNRGWLSRNDYPDIEQDPFIESDSAVAKSSNRAEGDSGRASLDDNESLMAEGRARVPGPGMTSKEMAGPKPIRQTGDSSVQTENGRKISPASYPGSYANGSPEDEKSDSRSKEGVKSYSGPSLSDFLQKKSATAGRSAAQPSAEPDALPARAISSTNSSSRDKMNPAATRAALPSITAEAESFGNFLEGKSGKVADASRNATLPSQEAETDVYNFASWAEQQKAEWSNSAEAAQSKAIQAPAYAKEKSETVFDPPQQAIREISNATTTAPEFDDFDTDTAEPLIRRSGAAAQPPALSTASPPAAANFADDENPFADSSRESHGSGLASAGGSLPKPPIASSVSRSKSTGRSLDDSFRMDTGWKPAQMTRP